MHPDRTFAWEDRAGILAFVAETAFAHVFAATPAGPRVAHVPVLVAGETLRFHLSNGNTLTPHLDGATALASVGGPGAYVSPNWYVDSATQVPTWNYAAVEIEGTVRGMDPSELVDLLDALTAEHEARSGQDWTRAKMAPGRFEAMCRGITGFELTIAAVRATAKASQNKSDADARGIAAGMRAIGNAAGAAQIESARGW